MNEKLMAGRACTKCGVFRLLTSFPKKRGRSDGRSSECKLCRLARRRARYARDPSQKLAKRKQYVEVNRGALAQKRRDGVEQLSDIYVKKRLLAGTRLKAADLSPELIELKRDEMCLRRIGTRMLQALKEEVAK